MLITIITTLMLMLAYFLILYAGVGFIQDKRFFGSAHKDILAVVPDRKERFKGAHTIGWITPVFAFLMYPRSVHIRRMGRRKKWIRISEILFQVHNHALWYGNF